jgi:hypothetical protein
LLNLRPLLFDTCQKTCCLYCSLLNNRPLRFDSCQTIRHLASIKQ